MPPFVFCRNLHAPLELHDVDRTLCVLWFMYLSLASQTSLHLVGRAFENDGYAFVRKVIKFDKSFLLKKYQIDRMYSIPVHADS